jgi:hypothetical protein
MIMFMCDCSAHKLSLKLPDRSALESPIPSLQSSSDIVPTFIRWIVTVKKLPKICAFRTWISRWRLHVQFSIGSEYFDLLWLQPRDISKHQQFSVPGGKIGIDSPHNFFEVKTGIGYFIVLIPDCSSVINGSCHGEYPDRGRRDCYVVVCALLSNWQQLHLVTSQVIFAARANALEGCIHSFLRIILDPLYWGSRRGREN